MTNSNGWWLMRCCVCVWERVQWLMWGVLVKCVKQSLEEWQFNIKTLLHSSSQRSSHNVLFPFEDDSWGLMFSGKSQPLFCRHRFSLLSWFYCLIDYYRKRGGGGGSCDDFCTSSCFPEALGASVTQLNMKHSSTEQFLLIPFSSSVSHCCCCTVVTHYLLLKSPNSHVK